MEEIKFTVDKEENIRLDKYISKIKEDFSRNYIQKLIDDEKILVNDKIEKKSYNIQANDEITIIIEEPKELSLEKKEDINLDIIYEDQDIIIINKPIGLIVHPVKGNKTDTLVNALLAHTDKLGNINGTIRPGIVHRLDKNTSGTIVVAKSKDSLNNLLKQFKNRDTNKVYRTILKGTLPYNSGTIDAPIGRDPKNRTKMAVIKNNSKKAVTEFKVLKRYKDYTYVEVNLKTGRTHQIRVHFSHLGYPIIGDKRYGSTEELFELNYQLLHAYKLGFYHPKTKKWAEYKADLPNKFETILSDLENKNKN
ncbi:MAG: RluA family pseudouridine synthase [Halanaerobiales bacterium]|nr:RluA family pseudouridine synthase [Halanaerobiales bacterium]